MDVPTAAGKTSGVLRCWLAALMENPALVPRRLAYVVNRRAVTDQVHEDALGLAKLAMTEPTRGRLLESLPGTDPGEPLKVHAFRGQRTLDDDWHLSPAQPAILAGTVDMLGSRLLFRAYVGARNWRRAQAAGLLGQDAWWVLDEPHLAEPLWRLLCAVRACQDERQDFKKPFWITAIGATHRETDPARTLSWKGFADPALDRRLASPRHCRVRVPAVKAADFVKEAERITDAALSPAANPVSVGIIVSTVKLAGELHVALAKKLARRDLQIDVVTGAMRGHERDEKMASPEFRAAYAAGERKRQRSALLIGTHCLEAGFDGDFDVLISDLASLPSVLQRLGRLNRIRDTEHAEAWFFRVKDSPGGKSGASLADAAHAWLLAQSAPCPDAAWKCFSGSRADSGGEPSLPIRWESAGPGERAAVSEPPVACPAFTGETAMLFACSTRLPGASEMRTDLFLHGYEAPDQALIYFVWREEARWLRDTDLSDALRLRRPRPGELAQRSFGAGRKALADLAARLQETQPQSLERCWIFEPWSGDVSALFAESRNGAWEPDAAALANRIVVLPPEAGGYAGGFIDAKAAGPVADIFTDCQPPERPITVRVWNGHSLAAPEGAERCQPPGDADYIDLLPEQTRLVGLAEELFERTGWAVLTPIAQPDGAGARPREVLLDDHAAAVASRARQLAEDLGLPPEIADQLERAAREHDRGKAHHQFQQFLDNPDPARPLAKSRRRVFGPAPFRHEALSALEAGHAPPLVRLLIGTHHGHGRPLFRDDQLPPRLDADQLASPDGEWLHDFAALHEQYHPWAIAWLEALLKAADATASRQIDEPDA